MNGTMLRETLHEVLPAEVIEEFAEAAGLVQRRRKLDPVTLVRSLVMAAGSDDSGRLADAYETYLQEAEHEVVRGAFYLWLSDRLVQVMKALAEHALGVARAQEPLLNGLLARREDWLFVDSETVTLRDSLAAEFPATSKPAGLKVHKVYSLGRNNTVDYWLSPAREHDARHLPVSEQWAGKGLIVDLGYASKKTIADCARHGIGLVMRLKDGWKPIVERLYFDGEDTDLGDGIVVDGLVELKPDAFDGATVDADVRIGRTGESVRARMVGIAGPDKYHWYLTLLPRSEFTPEEVAAIYAARWEIESDNKCDKGGARLDQIGATTPSSVRILVHAAMVKTILTNLLVHRDLHERKATAPPLHALALLLALAHFTGAIMQQFEEDDARRWDRIARTMRRRAEDPNWRSRPSPLDRLRGTVAPRGRPKRKCLAECPDSARSYYVSAKAA